MATNLHRYSAWLVFAIIAAGYWVLARFYPVLYVTMTYEDLYGEWMQMWLFVAVFVLATVKARQPGPYRAFFMLLAIAGLYTFLEEISYGQRLFGLQSPEFFEEYNIQGETNLHNFLTGPVSTVLKDVIEYSLALALIIYGLVYPLTLKLGAGLSVWLNRVGVAPSPLYLAPFFLLAALLEVGWFNFNEAEVAEILVGSGLNGLLLHYLFAGNAGRGTDAVTDGSDAASKRQALAYLALFASLAALAWGTTVWVNRDPAIRERTEDRLVSGYKKYAARMELKGRYAHAAEFYMLAHQGFEGDQDLLRSAVLNFKSAGDEKNYVRYYRELLEAEASETALASTGVDDQLSFARAYAEIGDADKEQQFLQRALFFAAERIRHFPQNPENYYWQGRALQQSGAYAEAMQAYARAAQLQPGEQRYATAMAVLERALKAPDRSLAAPD